MAEKTFTEIPPKTPKGERWFDVRLSRTWKLPTIGGKQRMGVIYQRGGYQFTTEKDWHRVPESELDKFRITVSPRLATGSPTREFDGNLVVTEVDGP